MEKKEIGNQVSFLVAKNIDMLKGDAIPKTLYLQILELCESLITQAQQEARKEVAKRIQREAFEIISITKDYIRLEEFINKYLSSDKEGEHICEPVEKVVEDVDIGGGIYKYTVAGDYCKICGKLLIEDKDGELIYKE